MVRQSPDGGSTMTVDRAQLGAELRRPASPLQNTRSASRCRSAQPGTACRVTVFVFMQRQFIEGVTAGERKS